MKATAYPYPSRNEETAFRLQADANYSTFNSAVVSEQTPVIELKPNYGLSALRDVQKETNGGTVTHSGAEYVLSTSATASSIARLESAERGRYQPGNDALAGVAFRRPTAPTGSQKWLAGYYDDDSGFAFGEDATEPFVMIRKNASDTTIYQSNWNVDKLDGTGESGLTLDMSAGVVFRFQFAYYGYGGIKYKTLVTDANGKSRLITVHTMNPDGITVDDPNLPITAQVDNGATASDFKGYVAGRQFAIIGRYAPNRRTTSEKNLSVGSVGTTYVPLVTFKKKSSFTSVSIKVDGFDVLGSDDAVLGIFLGSTLTTPAYGKPSLIPAAETAAEADIASTSMSGGILVYETMMSSSSGNKTNAAGVERLGLDIPAGQPITLAVRKVSGTGGTYSGVFRIREEW